jgi:xanthine dehydrogenase iron-sulfur cluster and FAD-binding subunit A
MADFTLQVNGNEKTVSVPPETPLLWVLRDTLELTGTKFGCGAGFCGACTVHVEGAAIRSCSTPVSQVAGKGITTIEGLGAKGVHVLQQAWIAEEVPQCGYCQTGQIGVRGVSPALGSPLSLRTERLDTLDLDLVFLQRSLHANSLPRKCLGFVLIVQAVDRLLARVVQDIFRAESRAHGGTAVLVAPHVLHFGHHFFVGSVFGAERIHDLARECLRVGLARLRFWLCTHEWRGEKQS